MNKKPLVVVWIIEALFVLQIVSYASVDASNYELSNSSIVNMLKQDDYVSDGELQ